MYGKVQVWAHWSHSFDQTSLSGASILLFSILSPPGVTVRTAAGANGPVAATSFVFRYST